MQEENFEKIVQDYGNIHKKSLLGLSTFDFRYFIKYRLDIVKKHILKEPKHILDFGCGIGESPLYISKIFPNAKITGIDTSLSSIESCNNLNIKNSNFHNLDITKSEIEKNYYDLIIAAGVFHHISSTDREKTLEKLLNALKPNGKMFIFELNPFNPITQLIFIKSIIDAGCSMISSRQLKMMIKNANKKDIKICSTNYIIFLPRFKLLEKIFYIEKYFRKIPVGCQYYITVEKYSS